MIGARAPLSEEDPALVVANAGRGYENAALALADAERELKIASDGLVKKQQAVTDARARVAAARARLSEASRRFSTP